MRASDPCLLFTEYLEGHWLRVRCNPDLGYRAKGRRDKRFPLLDVLRPLWDELQRGRRHGLLYERRSVLDGREHAPLRGASLAEVVGLRANSSSRRRTSGWLAMPCSIHCRILPSRCSNRLATEFS